MYQYYIEGAREGKPYEIDGLVVAYNSNYAHHKAGMKNHRPAGSIAYKFPHEDQETILNTIHWQIGKSGRITPVAEFQTINLGGAFISKATLHNLHNIRRLAAEAGQTGFRSGDLILVSRRNDVIPCVEALLEILPNMEQPLLHSPENCPCCGTAIVMDGKYLICPNEDGCIAQTAGQIKRWIKKLGVLGWGDAIIDGLCDQGIINDPADLYLLDPDKAANVSIDGRMIGRNAHRFLKDLHSKSVLPLHVFVGSLGIPMIGRSMCKRIVDAGYDTIESISVVTVSELAKIPDLGPAKAEAFAIGFDKKAVLVNKLLKNGVIILPPIPASPVSRSVSLSVCMTGFRDPRMVQNIEKLGGTIKSGVSKDLSILVCKDPNSTSSKVIKAKKYGIDVKSIEEMREFIAMWLTHESI